MNRRTRTTRRQPFTSRFASLALRQLEHVEAPYLVSLVGFIAIGLYLRLDHLDRQSLWFDEADAVMLAQQPLKVLIGNLAAAGQNGPLYTLLMHIWTGLFGTSEMAVRLPSALAGTTAIPLIYALGRTLHSPRLGLYASGILTIAPYQHWYSQEAKMYAPLVCAVLASTLMLIRACRDDRPLQWGVYVLITTITLYLHVMAILIIAAHAVWCITGGARTWKIGEEKGARLDASRRLSPRLYWAFAALTLPYLPIALWEFRFASSGVATWHRRIGIVAFVQDVLTKFATGVRADEDIAWYGLILFSTLALLGAFPVAWRRIPWPTPSLQPCSRSLLLICSVVIPGVLFYLLQIIRPLYADRYLIVITPAFILLVAGGLLTLERLAWPLVIIGVAGILLTSWGPLRDTNLAATAQKEDWRGVYTKIADHWHPNDAIIVHPGYLGTTLNYYALRDARLRDLPLITIPNEYFDGTTNDLAIERYLQRATVGYERVWVIASTDRLLLIDPFDQRGDCESDRLRNWYCYNAYQLLSSEVNGLWLGLYSYNGPYGSPFYPQPAIHLDLPIGQQLILVGYDYDLAPGISAVKPGGVLPLILQWDYRMLDGPRFAIHWSLLDKDGSTIPNVGGSEPVLGDRLPRSHASKQGTSFWDYHDLPLPNTLPAGRYRLIIEIVSTDTTSTPVAPSTIPLGWFTIGQ